MNSLAKIWAKDPLCNRATSSHLTRRRPGSLFTQRLWQAMPLIFGNIAGLSDVCERDALGNHTTYWQMVSLSESVLISSFLFRSFSLSHLQCTSLHESFPAQVFTGPGVSGKYPVRYRQSWCQAWGLCLLYSVHFIHVRFDVSLPFLTLRYNFIFQTIYHTFLTLFLVKRH